MSKRIWVICRWMEAMMAITPWAHSSIRITRDPRWITVSLCIQITTSCSSSSSNRSCMPDPRPWQGMASMVKMTTWDQSLRNKQLTSNQRKTPLSRVAKPKRVTIHSPVSMEMNWVGSIQMSATSHPHLLEGRSAWSRVKYRHWRGDSSHLALLEKITELQRFASSQRINQHLAFFHVPNYIQCSKGFKARLIFN